MIKYIKSVLWRVAKCLSYIEEARCLKVSNKQPTAGQSDTTSEEQQKGAKFAKAHVTDMDPLILPAHKTLPFIDRRAISHSKNNMNRARTVIAIHAMKNTEFGMIQIFTSSGFSWGQRENAVVTEVNWQRK